MFMYVPKAIKVPTEILSAFKITIPTKYNEMHPSPQDKSIIEPKQSLIRIAFLNYVLLLIGQKFLQFLFPHKIHE